MYFVGDTAFNLTFGRILLLEEIWQIFLITISTYIYRGVMVSEVD